METITTKNAPWFRRWFDSSFYHQLYANRSEIEAADFIDNLLKELRPSQNSCMMDLGCGTGRHAKYLASKGFRVTGTDLAFSSITTAKKFTKTNLDFFQHDMRNSFGSADFDYVFNFFTSFGYFKTNSENQKVINNIAEALKPGGTLVLDYLNVHYSEERLVCNEEKEIDGIMYHITRWADDKYFNKKIVIDNIQGKEPFEYTEQVAKLYLHNFATLFQRSGLQLKKVFGSYQLDSYDITTSPRLILIAEKK